MKRDKNYEIRKKREGFIGQKMITLPLSMKKIAEDNPLISDLYLTDVGYFPNAQDHFRNRPEGSDEHIFIYCVEGIGWVEVKDKVFDLTPNSYFIIPKNHPHRYWTSRQNPWTIYWIHFKGKKADLIYQRYAEHNHAEHNQPTVRIAPFDDQRVKIFNRTLNLLTHGFTEKSIEIVNIRMLQFISSFIYHEEESAFLDFGEDEVYIAINFMKENLEKSLKIEQLASEANYSVSHFTAVFKSKTGFTPIHYFNDLKIQRACQFLQFTDLSIKQLCYKLGFQDPFYFSRIFKKRMGVSPLAYRKLNDHGKDPQLNT